eukprot:1933105-Alexandrium_andersonii.AAC.1
MVLEKLQQAFRWTPWERDHFRQTGLDVAQEPGGRIKLSQRHYLGEIAEIYVDATRKKAPRDKITDKERTQLRGALGSIQWAATQTMPGYLAECSILQSRIPEATVE